MADNNFIRIFVLGVILSRITQYLIYLLLYLAVTRRLIRQVTKKIIFHSKNWKSLIVLLALHWPDFLPGIVYRMRTVNNK